jgi:hypothetical protein
MVELSSNPSFGSAARSLAPQLGLDGVDQAVKIIERIVTERR